MVELIVKSPYESGKTWTVIKTVEKRLQGASSPSFGVPSSAPSRDVVHWICTNNVDRCELYSACPDIAIQGKYDRPIAEVKPL